VQDVADEGAHVVCADGAITNIDTGGKVAAAVADWVFFGRFTTQI
jgi:hypothetical protein